MSEVAYNPFNKRTEYVLWAAFDWLDDCGLVVDEGTLDDVERTYTARGVILNVDRFHEGGWLGFLEVIKDDEEWGVVASGTSPEGVHWITEKSNFGNTRTVLD